MLQDQNSIRQLLGNNLQQALLNKKTNLMKQGGQGASNTEISKGVMEQYAWQMGGNLISQRRIDLFQQRSMDPKKIAEFENAVLRDEQIKMLYTNLLIGADNPFQAEPPEIYDISFHQKTKAKSRNDYTVSGSLSYVFHGKYLKFASMMKEFDKIKQGGQEQQ